MMSKKRRLRAEVSERQREKTMIKEKKSSETKTTETAATTGGLFKTFLAATRFSITFIIIFIVYIRLMSWLSVVEWSQSRCELLSPSILKTVDLKSLLNDRGISCLSELSKQDLESAVWETGGVMKIEMEALLEAGDSTNNSNWDAEKFETWNEFQDSVSKQSVSIYLVLCSTELERKASELKRWRQFLHRLSKHGVKFMFVRCDVDGDCDSPKVILLSIWNPRGYKTWSHSSYAGPMRPGDILQWIIETLFAHVVRANSATDVVNIFRTQPYTVTLVAHSTRPLPLSYAILASELRGKVSFFWVETLDKYLPDRASLVVLSPDGSMVYPRDQFLNQAEIRWLLRMLTMDADYLVEVIGIFLVVIAVTIPLVADGGVWQRVKAMLWFLFVCVLAIGLFVAWEDSYNKDCHEVLQSLARSFRTLIKSFHPDLLLLFHLFSEYPVMQFVFPAYLFLAIFNARIAQFFENDVRTFFSRLFITSRTSSSDSPEPTSVPPVSTQMHPSVAKTPAQIPSHVTKVTIQMPTDVAKTTAQEPSDVTKVTIKMPLNVAKTTAKIAANITQTTAQMATDVAKTTAQVPSDVIMATGGGDGRNGPEKDDLSASARKFIAVPQSQSLESLSSSSSAGPQQHDPLALPIPSNKTLRAYSTTQPFAYPPLEDSANGDLDKTTAEQMARLKIPKLWLLPIVSDKELKLATALQKSEARDQRSFESASRIVPCCFYCGADFQPTSEVKVLPCQDIFHPGCLDDWMKAGNVDCPQCHIPLYATDRRNLA